METIPITDIKTGDIILTSGTTLLSEGIQEFQEMNNPYLGRFSHALIARWEGDILYATEAQKRGICNNDFVKRYMNDEYKTIMVLRFNQPIEDERLIQLMMPFIGNTRYDKLALIWQAIKMLTKGKLWLGEKKQNSRKFICSEWCAFVYNLYFEEHGERIFANESEMAPVDLALDKRFKRYLLK